MQHNVLMIAPSLGHDSCSAGGMTSAGVRSGSWLGSIDIVDVGDDDLLAGMIHLEIENKTVSHKMRDFPT